MSDIVCKSMAASVSVDKNTKIQLLEIIRNGDFEAVKKYVETGDIDVDMKRLVE